MLRTIKVSIVISTIILVLPLSSFSDIATEYPDNDARIFEGQPDTNFGTMSSLSIGWRTDPNVLHANSLLKFDLSAYAGENINSATLRLYVYGYYVEMPDDIFIALNDSDWQEGTVTWNTKPDYFDETDISDSVPYSYGVWWEIDVADYVQYLVDGTYQNYGFQLYQNDEEYHCAETSSKEHTNQNAPELVLDYGSSAIETASLGEVKAVFK